MKSRRILTLCIFVMVINSMFIQVGRAYAQDGGGDGWVGGGDRWWEDGDDGDEGDGGDVVVTTGGGGGTQTIIQKIASSFKIFFPADIFSEGLTYIFRVAAGNEVGNMQGMVQAWSASFTEMFKAPPPGFYETIARESMSAAVGLAVPFFILRIAIYQWNNLVGNKDDLLAVIGDWLTSGLFVIISGPGLDLIVKLSWWITGLSIGNPAALAQQYVGYTVAGMKSYVLNSSFMGVIIVTAIAVTALLAVAAIALALISGSVTLYILAVISPVIMVVGVIPQVRWLRNMWLQGAVIVAMLPIAASTIFTVGLKTSSAIPPNILGLVIRVLFLFAASGFLFTLSGFLGKFTIGAATDAAKGMLSAGKKVVDLAGAAAVGIATAGVGSGVAAAGVAGGGAAGLGGVAATQGGAAALGGGGASKAGLMSAQQSYGRALDLNKGANAAASLGMDKTASALRGASANSQIAARQGELKSRLASFDASSPRSSQASAAPSFGYGPAANSAIGKVFNGPDADKLFQKGIQGLKGIEPERASEFDTMLQSGSERVAGDIAKMAMTFVENEGLFTNETPRELALWEIAQRSGVTDGDVFQHFLGGS